MKKRISSMVASICAQRKRKHQRKHQANRESINARAAAAYQAKASGESGMAQQRNIVKRQPAQ